MSAPKETPALATFADVAELPEERRLEILDGVIVEKASPSFEHGASQMGLAGFLQGPFNRRGGGGGPGGWWFASECDVELDAHQVLRPDICGWRRDRVPERPSGRPVRIRPDWVCEILSESNARTDLVTKFHILQRHQVPHYWIVDPARELLTVYRWQPNGYLVALQAARGERVRAEPFEIEELAVGSLFGDEEDEAP